jgi:hypothetical protein
VTVTEQLAQLLHDLGLGVYKTDGSAGGTIYLTVLPDLPDEALAVARYPGPTSDSKLGYDSVNAQVRVRGGRDDVRVGEAKAQAVYDALHGLGERPLAGGGYLQLAVGNQSGPVYMGRDGAGRHEWAVNVAMELRRPTANRT